MSTWNVITSLLSLVVVLVIIGWMFFRTLQKSDDPGSLLRKWLITVPLLCVIGYCVRVALVNPFFGVPAAAFFAVVLGVLWAPNIATTLFSPLTDIFDGGREEVEPKPLYAVAETKRKRGEYQQALAEVRKQLTNFPSDFTGQLLLAAIYAENLNDVSTAQMIVESLVTQPGRTQPEIAGALQSLADWQLKYSQDPSAARQALEQIQTMLPNTQWAHAVAQRIAHLPTIDRLAEIQQTPTIPLHAGERDLGLRQDFEDLKPPPQDHDAEIERLIAHLRQHPVDAEAREKLACLYAEHCGRVDFAEGQLQQLISLPDQPAKHIVRWLNLLADLQVKYGDNPEASRQTVRRIIDLFPGTAYAEQASTRLAYMWSEDKGHKNTHTIKLGQYERDLGLKNVPPKLRSPNLPNS